MMRYIGAGMALEGIPPRNLSDAEVMHLADRLFRPNLEDELTRSGLYERVVYRKLDTRRRADKLHAPISENKGVL